MTTIFDLMARRLWPWAGNRLAQKRGAAGAAGFARQPRRSDVSAKIPIGSRRQSTSCRSETAGEFRSRRNEQQPLGDEVAAAGNVRVGGLGLASGGGSTFVFFSARQPKSKQLSEWKKTWRVGQLGRERRASKG